MSTKDLRTSTCCTAGSPPPSVREILKTVPEEVKAKFYGCGSPCPIGIDGLRCGTTGQRVPLCRH